MYNQNGTYIGRSLVLYGEWSEIDLFQKNLRPGDHAIEAGSNIDVHTVFVSNAVGNAGQVYSFEPVRYTYQLLNANLAQ